MAVKKITDHETNVAAWSVAGICGTVWALVLMRDLSLRDLSYEMQLHYSVWLSVALVCAAALNAVAFHYLRENTAGVPFLGSLIGFMFAIWYVVTADDWVNMVQMCFWVHMSVYVGYALESTLGWAKVVVDCVVRIQNIGPN